jgi:hypothetical protein
MQTKLPAGGPLKVSPNVAALFLAQIEVITLAHDDRAQSAAVRRRSRALKRLNARQRGLAELVADVVTAKLVALKG